MHLQAIENVTRKFHMALDSVDTMRSKNKCGKDFVDDEDTIPTSPDILGFKK